MLNDATVKQSQRANVVGIEARKRAAGKRVFILNIVQSLYSPISWFKTHTLRPSTATGINRICQICAAYFTFIDLGPFRSIYYKRALF